MNVLTLIVMVILAEGFLHYFPWRIIFKGKELHRLGAYTLGLLGMMGPLSAWLWQTGALEVIKALWSVNIAAGLTVFALYGLDHYLDQAMKLMESEEREKRDGQKS